MVRIFAVPGSGITEASDRSAIIVHRYEGVAFNEAGELFGSRGVLEASFATNAAYENRDRTRYERRAQRIDSRLPVIEGEHLWITDRLSHFYYHWLCDALPRLEGVSAGSGKTRRLMLPRRVAQQQFVGDSLPAWAEFEPVCPSGSDGSGRAETLLVTGRAAETPLVNRNLVRHVSARLVRHFGRPVSRSGRRIYVSRAGARMRRVANEADILGVLRRHGFECVHMEGMQFADQVSLLRETEVLAGPHGGGLTNMMFMTPGSGIVEMRSAKGPPPCYRNLAEALGHTWQGIDCPPVDPAMHLHGADIHVDPVVLDRCLAGLRTAG